MTKKTEFISVENVSFSYSVDEQENRAKALDNVSLQISCGSYTAILGPNGSGKSTLAKLIDILELPSDGKIVVFGIDTRDEDEFWRIRKSCACVFQNPDNQIVGTTVEEDIAFGPENLGIPNPELRQRVDYALEKTGLTPLADRQTATLSGGQKQKLAIAGVLAMKPDVLILDEATAMLDPEARDEFLELVERMQKERNFTVITITHDMSEAARCDYIYIIKEGHLVADGKPEELFCKENEMEQLGLDCPVNVKLTSELARRAGVQLKPSDVSGIDNCAETIRRILDSNSELPLKEEKAVRTFSEPALTISNLSYSYDGTTPALKDINLEVYRGEILAIVGKSGCGKTTLISHMNGLNRPQSGEVTIHASGGELRTSNKKQIKDIRHTVGLVFQYPEYQLFEETVYKDVAFGPSKMGITGDELDRRVRQACKAVKIPEKLLEVSPFDLSGGQKRRVAMAGVIAMEPEILVLDEPASGLDPKGRKDMFSLIDNLRENGTTIILVSHNMDEAAEHADRICCIKNGRIEAVGTPSQIFRDEERVREIGLALPKLQSFASGIYNSCDGVFSDAVTVDEAANMLIRMKRGETNA